MEKILFLVGITVFLFLGIKEMFLNEVRKRIGNFLGVLNGDNPKKLIRVSSESPDIIPDMGNRLLFKSIDGKVEDSICLRDYLELPENDEIDNVSILNKTSSLVLKEGEEKYIAILVNNISGLKYSFILRVYRKRGA